MNTLYEHIYKSSPNAVANLLVTLYNIRQFRIRHGGEYPNFRKYFEQTENWSPKEIENEQLKRLRYFLKHTYEHSPYYRKKWGGLNLDFDRLDWNMFRKLPLMTKEELQKNIKDICTINPHSAVKFQTGGTTGVSLQVYYTPRNIQERFAMVEHFRSRFGFKFGERTAWFTGKDLLNQRDVSKHRYWKTDYQNKIQFYSTFYIQQKNIPYYIENLNKYQPPFFSGITSSLAEIAKGGLKAGLKLNYQPKAIFPTAEMLLKSDRVAMEMFYGCGVYDQYASSEGAPFITQCKNGHMHFEMTSGIFEVLDSKDQPSDFGELVVTSFTTEGTPLVRYRIGDLVELETKKTDCYLHYPVVKKIHGRFTDCLYSRETGKVCQGNIANSVKHVNGVQRFQIIQNDLDAIHVQIVKTDEYRKEVDECKLAKELRIRLGKQINIQFKYVPEIPKERSGKFRLVKNYCKETI
ncbi:adenylyltransferase [Prolixibacter bellariivorans]|uniref:Adenylyltransferase n=1 Tax=Prolixibacter bellariivorans TaxID=314319 RepID=A0A5M4B2T9_9BACT|nr:phenylacetate--CoA ligase family protein [Prolixibacter bellariivorans]GET34206.1 adenylyltransferase [Prolixibacter bellariivorans]